MDLTQVLLIRNRFKILSIEQAVVLLVLCFSVAALADIAAVIAFVRFKKDSGIALMDFSDMDLHWKYLRSPVGIILFVLGIVPYGLGLLGLQLIKDSD